MPLSPDALAVVMLVESMAKGGDFVFSLDGEKPVSTAAMAAVLKRLAAKGELPSDIDGRPAVVHGFRSSFRDWAAESEYPDPIAEAALAHAEKDGTVAAYKRTDYFEQRRPMMIEWAGFLADAPVRRQASRSKARISLRNEGACAVGRCPINVASQLGPVGPLGGAWGLKSIPASHSQLFDQTIGAHALQEKSVMVHPTKPAASRPAPMMSSQSRISTQEMQHVLIPIRHFASEIGRSRQFMYSEMNLGRLTTILHGGRRFVHHVERDRYIAAVLAASPDYVHPASQSQKARACSKAYRRARRREDHASPSGRPTAVVGPTSKAPQADRERKE